MTKITVILMAFGLTMASYAQETEALLIDYLAEGIDGVQLAVAIIENGSPRYLGYLKEKEGVQTIENHQDKYEIGSISKVFTSTLLAGLVIDKQVTLSDRIDNHIDIDIKDDHTLTLLSLSNHTSGLPALPSNLGLLALMSQDPYAEYDQEQLETYLSQEFVQEDSLVGQYRYSNLGAGLLGHVLSIKEGLGYEELLQNRIFSLYEMANSSSIIDTSDSTLVKGIGIMGQPTANWNFKALAGAGAIVSTVEDLVKFASAHLEEKNAELNLTREKTFTVNEKMDLGLGWHILKEKDATLHWHNGGTGGYSSSIAMDVESKTAVIILSNVSVGNPLMKNLDKLCFNLMTTIKE